jgi:hypothetical protein
MKPIDDKSAFFQSNSTQDSRMNPKEEDKFKGRKRVTSACKACRERHSK